MNGNTPWAKVPATKVASDWHAAGPSDSGACSAQTEQMLDNQEFKSIFWTSEKYHIALDNSYNFIALGNWNKYPGSLTVNVEKQ